MARRHSHDASERRTQFVGFQVTPTERADLAERAARTGETLSELCRRLTLAEAGREPPTPRDAKAIRALTTAIVRVGTNHNQLAALGNKAWSLPVAAERRAASEALAAAFAKGDFQRVTDEILAALAKVAAL